MSLTTAAIQAVAASEPTGIVGFAERVMEALGEWGVGALTFLETVVPPIPSEVILPLAGFVARQGQLSVPLLMLASTLGAYLGALVLYGSAALLGQARAVDLLSRLPLVESRDFERSARWFQEHGRRSVFFGRLVPGVRALVSLPAGAVRMPLLWFSLFTIVGSALWNGLLIGLGWVLGARYELVYQYSWVLDWAVVVTMVALVGWLVVRRIRRRDRPVEPDAQVLRQVPLPSQPDHQGDPPVDPPVDPPANGR
jgi:membrane protein DedA with SNARE-associated domain